jgi:hypothetical protein
MENNREEDAQQEDTVFQLHSSKEAFEDDFQLEPNSDFIDAHRRRSKTH